METNKSIVSLKGDDIFTDSKIIADGTENQHHTITKLIRTYKKQILTLGKVGFEIHALGSGQKTKIYQLNEQQAAFIMALMKNSDIVVEFKLRLVKEFYRMRMALMQRQSAGWLETRQNGKMIRRAVTDAIAELIEYAIASGSTHSHVFYTNYTKIVNTAAGIKGDERDKASIQTLTQLAFYEDVIMNTIREEISKGTPYKDVYYICKAKIEQITGLTYLPETKLLIN